MKLIHPGRILKRGMLARSLSANKLSLSLRVPSGRITQILNGKCGISAETALRLARYFGNNVQFWINLQSRYDLTVVEQNVNDKVIPEVEQAGM
ncbi:MAG: HigA family addiction module antitoxin [Desulfobacterales bacterium]|jgi:addiction module HigA family antidote